MNKINKSKNFIFLTFILISILSSSVYAEKISIFSFNYDNGEITLKQQITKDGFYPDRLVQPEKSYSCELIDKNIQRLYYFKFDLPINIYTDTIENNQTIGNIIILNQTDFSFILPYKQKATNIICYNQRGYEIINENIEKITLSPKKSNNWILIYIILATLGLIIIIYKSKRYLNKKDI
jgi:hypothetical protein